MTKLVLDDEGSGSHAEIVAYVQRVIESRTTVNDDTTAARIARGITDLRMGRDLKRYWRANGRTFTRNPGDGHAPGFRLSRT